MTQLEDDEIIKMKRGLSWIDLKESLNTDGCPVCNTMTRSLNKYFEFLLYEYALDASVHKKTLASFGMCNNHTYLLKEAEADLKSDGLNISVLYETILQKEIKLLGRIEEKELRERKRYLPNFGKSPDFISYKKEILSDLIAKGICPGCMYQKESESYCTHVILQLYKDNEFQNKFVNERILLCRRHFLFLINEAEQKQTIDYFIKVHKTKIKMLYTQLSGFIQNHDYYTKNKMTEEEKKSWEKALEYFGSKENIDRGGYNDLLIK